MGSTLGAIGGSLASNIGGGKSSGSGNSLSSSYGTSSGTASNTSPFGNTLGYAGLFQDKQIQGLLDQYLASATNALTKGQLSGAGIPMAQAAISQARGAAAANLGSAENFLARSGGANSPFAGQLLSGIAAQGNEATAQAPVGIYQMLLGQIPGFLQGMQGEAFQAMGQAGSLNNSSSFTGSTHNVTRDYTKQSGGGFTF